MGLKKSCAGKISNRDESAVSPSSSPGPRRRQQSGQAPQQTSTASNEVVVTPPVAPHKVHGPQASSTAPIDFQAARLERVRIHNRPQIPSTNCAGALPVHPVTASREERMQACSSAPAIATPHNSPSLATGRRDRPGTRTSDLNAANPQSTSSTAERRSKPARRAPGGRLSFSQSLSQVFQPGPYQQAPIIGRPTGGAISTQRGSAQQKALRSLLQSANLPGPHTVRPAVGVGTGTDASRQGATSSEGSAQDSAVAPDGRQFFPPPVNGTVLLPGYDTSQRRGERSPACKIGIGIETEFLLRARQPENRRWTLVEFTEVVAAQHNSRVVDHHPEMMSDVQNSRPRTRFDRWALIVDHSMSTSQEPWGIEMITPLFVAFPGSHWRSHVQATWSYLQRHYEITGHKDCGTHVHVSLEGGYSLDELKLVAQAALHFETAFEVLVPETRRHHSESRSSWIDSREFAIKGKSRADSISMISSVTDFETLSNLIQPYTVRGYNWNFRSIMKYYTIEFRKPPASKTANEALGWAELAMSFVQTSIKYASPERLSLIPPTVGGLRWFLRQNHVPRLNEPDRLNWIWEGKDPNAYLEGRPLGTLETPAQLLRIRRMVEIDRRRILRLINSTQEPYWLD